MAQVLLTPVVRGRANPRYMTMPKRLRRARRAANLTGSALSLLAGVGRNSVADIEDGGRVPRIHTLERIADALKLSPAYLAYGLETDWDPPGEAPPSSELSVRFKAARLLRGWSYREVDRRASCGEGTALAIEAGRMPSIDIMEQLALALAVSPAWLAYGIGPRELPRRGRRVEVGAPPLTE